MRYFQCDVSYSAPESVNSVYKPIKPTRDINTKQREEFWRQMQQEEEQRKG